MNQHAQWPAPCPYRARALALTLFSLLMAGSALAQLRMLIGQLRPKSDEPSSK